jgi:hypothetical protein
MDMQADLVFRLTRGNLAEENVLRATYHMRVPALQVTWSIRAS